ncbi:sugar-binding protein [Pseudomonas sp. SDO55104_S430]
MSTVTAEKTNVHSNAFNFRSFVDTGVDKRTGIYTVSLKLHEVEVNDLRGPVVPLSLHFNPMSWINNGYGEGWRLAQTQYVPATQVITTHTGESFKVTGTDPAEPGRMTMKEQKIESFKLYELSGDPQGDYKVVYVDGTVEILKRTGTQPQEAIPVVMYSATGHKVTLSYQAAGQGRMLSEVRDSQGLLVQVIRNLTAGTVEINLKPTQGVPLAQFALHLESDLMTRITLPTSNRAGWRFLYGLEREQRCMKEVWNPFGGHERIGYNDGGHEFPGSVDYLAVPRVTDHVMDPGGGQPPIVMKYAYSNDGSNFLGYGAPINFTDDGLDNLYKVLAAYTYQTIEQLMNGAAVVRTVTRTFNRFHLLVEEETVQGTYRQATTTTYYADDKLSFDQQVRQCQLPKQTDTRWEDTADPRNWRIDTEKSEYDIHGNQTLSQQANGITETTSYYPAAGEGADCPPDPYGFVKYMKEKTVTPASDPARIPNLEPGAPVLRTRYKYVEKSPISSATTAWVAPAEESFLEVSGQSETLLERTVTAYIDNPGNPLLHGQIERTAVTRGGRTTFTDFAYSKVGATYRTLADAEVLRTVQTVSTDFDAVSKQITEEVSLFNALPVLTTDKNVQIRTTYDELGRALTETVAPGDPQFAATRSYSYRLIHPAGQGETPESQPASQVVENVKGVKTRSVFDGLNRAIEEEQQDVDNAGGQPAVYRKIYAASYNTLGQMITETEHDWLEKKDLPLTSTFTYDNWGQQDSITGPDGVKTNTVNDPITFTSEEWIEGMGKTITVSNRFEKPVSVERRDIAGKRISLHTYKYDGVGRTHSEKNAGGFETLYKYDVYDRMTETTLPDRAKVARSYALHSRNDLPELISVNGRKLGTQTFDGLERMIESVTGGRVTTYTFDTSDSEPDVVTLPSGAQIRYTYNHVLTAEPQTRTAISSLPAVNDIAATYKYDPLNARLLESSEQGTTLVRTYNSNGEVATEARDGYNMAYLHSRMGRLVRYTDVLGQIQTYEYDDGGRLATTELGDAGKPGHVKSEFTYNLQGLTESIHTQDTAGQQNLTISLGYDDHGRETSRVFDFGATAERLSQAWNELDQVVSRQLNEKADGTGASLRAETYEYEMRGRLEYYTCSGPLSPVDHAGNIIDSQEFYFDDIDNIEEVRTRFPGGSNTAKYTYVNEDPAQLSAISNSNAAYKAFDMTATYDDNGNMEADYKFRMTYDTLNRLETVSELGGGASRGYVYDGEDALTGANGDGVNERVFYRNDEPANRVDGDQRTTFMYGNGQPLAQREDGDGPKS